MTKSRDYRPDGFQDLTPYLVVSGAERLMDFLRRAFDAAEIYCSRRPDGTIMHAQLKVGDSMLELADAPEQRAPAVTTLHFYVRDVDGVYAQAVKAGGVALMEPTDQFYGERSGAVTDPCGNSWYIATRTETLTEGELAARAAAHRKS